jgi:hypothetical protein
LQLVVCLGVLAQARPEAGYSYSSPSSTYGAPGGGLISGGGGFGGGGIGISSAFAGGGLGTGGLAQGGGFGGGSGAAFSSGVSSLGISSGGSGAAFGGDSGIGIGGGSLVQKHIYVHVPPPEPEEHIAQRLPQFRPAQKHYKIVFIKAPTPPTPTAANIQLPGQDEQKTLIYVLVKKPDEAEELNIQQPAPTQPSKPEVYFIKYKTQKQVSMCIIRAVGQSALPQARSAARWAPQSISLSPLVVIRSHNLASKRREASCGSSGNVTAPATPHNSTEGALLQKLTVRHYPLGLQPCVHESTHIDSWPETNASRSHPLNAVWF